jgi:hypothetical protein
MFLAGGQREMHLKHQFASPLKGDFSIWFYDVAPGQETLYEKLTLYSSQTPDSALIGTQDFDAFCYTAQLSTSGQNFGPNANCEIYPQVTTTNVHRTPGWHLLDINVSANGISYSIDGNQVFSTIGDYRFDIIDITVSGPDWRPNTVAYFDDFAFSPLSVIFDNITGPFGAGYAVFGLSRISKPQPLNSHSTRSI